MEEFLKTVKTKGVKTEGECLWNCEVSGGNDIFLMYPAIHMTSSRQDIMDWLDRQTDTDEDLELARDDSEDRKIVQGTYSIVESLYPSQEILMREAEQLTVLLGFRTTDDNCVDTEEADEERHESSEVSDINEPDLQHHDG